MTSSPNTAGTRTGHTTTLMVLVQQQQAAAPAERLLPQHPLAMPGHQPLLLLVPRVRQAVAAAAAARPWRKTRQRSWKEQLTPSGLQQQQQQQAGRPRDVQKQPARVTTVTP